MFEISLQAWNLRQPEQGLELFLRRACELRRLKRVGASDILAGVRKRATKWASAGHRELFDSHYSMPQSQVVRAREYLHSASVFATPQLFEAHRLLSCTEITV